MVPDLTAGSRRLSACSADTMNHAGFLDINWGENTHRNGKETAKPSAEEGENCLCSTFSPVTGLHSGLLDSGSLREREVEREPRQGTLGCRESALRSLG